MRQTCAHPLGCFNHIFASPYNLAMCAFVWKLLTSGGNLYIGSVLFLQRFYNNKLTIREKRACFISGQNQSESIQLFDNLLYSVYLKIIVHFSICLYIY